MDRLRPRSMDTRENPTTTTTTAKTQLPVRLPTDQYEALKAYAFFTKRSMNEIISQAVQEFLTGSARSGQMKTMLNEAQDRYRVVLDKLKDL